ncbi:MazG-like family protein [Paenibacillus sp. JTLBN-2024]
MTEEVGETSQAMLSYRQASGSEYKKLGLSDVKEECVDVILVALALFYKLSEG